jgi:CubicO group peptidase (beta-lactamase class C family)
VAARAALLAVPVSCLLLAVCGSGSDRVDRYLRDIEADGFSGSVALYRDGAIEFSAGYGFANRERGLANSAETVFPFGSNVKDLTRAGIIELELDGLLTRDRTLADFFPDVPADKRAITIQQLLTHTSGLLPYHGERVEGVPADHVSMTEEAARDSIFGQSLLFEPGERFAYSNSGYTLLAMIIERVTGRTYPEFIADRFVEPAGMTNSGFYRDPRWSPEDVAVGYGRVRYGEENSPVYWPRNAWPVAGNGGMAGPLSDLVKAFLHIDARRRESTGFDLAWRETLPSDEAGDMYAAAGGNDFGFVSLVFYWPDRGLGLALAINNDDDGVEDPEMVLDLLRLGFGIGRQDLMPDAPAEGRPDMSGVEDIPPPVGDWGLPPDGTWRRVGAVLDALAADDDSARRALVADLFTPEFRSMLSLEEHLGELETIRAAILPIDVERLERANQVEFTMLLRSATNRTYELRIDLEPRAPFRIAALGFRATD